MKVKLIISLLLAVFLLVPHSVVLASSDKAFNTTRLNKFGSVAIVLGNKFGFDISGFIIPFFNKERQTAVPDFYPGADFKEGISQYTLPQSKVDLGKIINWNEAENPVFLTALYGAILQTDAEHSNHPEKTDCFITETMEKSSDLPNAPTHFQWGQWLNGIYGIRELLPTDEGTGVHDFNRNPIEIASMNPNEDCKKHELGFELEKIENDTKKLAAFGAGTETEGHEVTTIMTIVEKIIDGILTLVEEPETEPHKDDVILTMDQKQPWFNFMCNDYWCPGNETSDDSSKTDITGGWTNFLFSFHQQEKVLAASLQPYKIKILNFPQKPIKKSYDAFNQSEYGMKGAGCSVSPYTPGKNIQEDLTLGGKVKIIDRCIPPPKEQSKEQCPIDIIKEKAQSPSDNACRLVGNGGSNYTNGQRLSPLAIKVLETAADAYKVPASVLVGTMLLEGGFNHAEDWDFSSDENIEKYSDCNESAPLPKCEEFANAIDTGSTAPFGFLPGIWSALMATGNPYDGAFLKVELDGLDEVLQDVTSFSACNFTDAAFMAARLISESSHALTSSVPSSCTAPDPYGEIPMYTGSIRPGSCGSWTADRVATARYQYGGGSTIGTCTPADPANSYNIGYLIDIWKALTP